MTTDQSIHSTPPLCLPITGKREGRVGVVVGAALVANDDFSHLCLLPHRWSLDGKYPARCVGTGKGERKRKVYLHHLVFAHYHGEVPGGMEIDHIDGNKLNSLPTNLRAVSHSVNMANQRRYNPTGFRGVTRNGKKGRWLAQITVRRRHYNLGAFDTPREAADAVNQAYREHYPELPIPNP